MVRTNTVTDLAEHEVECRDLSGFRWLFARLRAIQNHSLEQRLSFGGAPSQIHCGTKRLQKLGRSLAPPSFDFGQTATAPKTEALLTGPYSFCPAGWGRSLAIRRLSSPFRSQRVPRCLGRQGRTGPCAKIGRASCRERV